MNAAPAYAIALFGFMSFAFYCGMQANENLNPRPAPDHISLDLNQWECRQAITVQVLEGGKLTPKGQCIRYDMLIEKGEDQ